MPPDRRPPMIYILPSVLNIVNPRFPRSLRFASQDGVHIQYDTGPMPRVLLRLVELGGYKVREHRYISLLALPPHYPLDRCSTDAIILS
jgi:hypothetical protein